MNKIDVDTLNYFFADICAQFIAGEKYPVSGQRDVYHAMNTAVGGQYIVKVAHYTPYTIERLQRELSVLAKIESEYFPSVVWQTTATKDYLENYFDQLYYQTKGAAYESIRKEVDIYRRMPINPFLVTVEKFVENVPWEEFNKDITERKICELLMHCFYALKQLWGKRIVHRDLKPANILIGLDMRPVIIDLGIAKSLNEGTKDLTLAFFRNPHTVRFASPEQLADHKNAINYKTDQYSLGVVAYNALSGKFPFGDIEEIGPEQVMRNMFDFSYISLGSLGIDCCEEFESILKKFLMPHPYQRFRDADTVICALKEAYGRMA